MRSRKPRDQVIHSTHNGCYDNNRYNGQISREEQSACCREIDQVGSDKKYPQPKDEQDKVSYDIQAIASMTNSSYLANEICAD